MYQELCLLRPEMLDFYAHYMCNLKKSISSFSGPRLWGFLMKQRNLESEQLEKKERDKTPDKSLYTQNGFHDQNMAFVLQ